MVKDAAGTAAAHNDRYQITQNDEGVYLKVCKPAEEAEVLRDLADRRIIVFERDKVSRAVSETSGQLIRIAESGPAAQAVADIRVLVRRDRMEAMIEVTVPRGAPEVTMVQLADKLKAAGIVYGVDEDALERLTKVRAFYNTCCARGLPARDGDDACLTYHVDLDSQGRPVELEDGRVDFKNINHFISVEQGQLLVEKTPPTAGVAGMDVLGLPVPSRRGKEIPWPLGRNVTVVDGCRLVAAIAGQLSIIHRRVHVLPVMEIAGDVDYSTGNIDFMGSVIIGGSVESGFSVKAGGNVEIRGAIGGGMVEANNITVRTGIQGMNRSVVRARERLVANFIENATVYADKDVVVSDVIMHSKVFAGSRIIVEGRRGLVLGGRLSAGEEIRVRTAGSQAQAATDLEVSVNPFLKDEMLKLREEIKKKEELAEELVRSLAYLRGQGLANLPAAARERHDKLEAEYKGLPDTLEDMRLRYVDIESLLYCMKPGKIRVANILYPGVRVAIGPLAKVIDDPLKYLSLYAQDREIKFASFR